MTKVVFFDTETTGLPLFDQPSEHPDQPHIVQIGACLVDLDTLETISTLDVIIRPHGWTVPDEVAAIHGITTEMAQDVGVPASMAIGLLIDLIGQRTRIGHNEQFDARMVRIALLRHFDAQLAEEWKLGPSECTVKLASPIMKLPPTAKMKAVGRNHFKTPNLGEAYKFFTGRDLVGAHSALVDVHACRDVYLAIKHPPPKSAVAMSAHADSSYSSDYRQ